MAQIKTKFIENNAVTNAKAAQMAANTIKGNNTGSTANASDLSISSVQTMLSIPTSSSPLPLNAGGTGISAGSANAAFNALSPLTTKGDLVAFSTVNARVAVGTNGQVLTADSGAATGVSWQSPAAAIVPAQENITLSGTDITNQYVDIGFAAYGSSASDNSIELDVAGGPMQLKAVDYTVSLTGGAGGVTRISFAGDLATGGGAALVAGDILMISYMHA